MTKEQVKKLIRRYLQMNKKYRDYFASELSIYEAHTLNSLIEQNESTIQGLQMI